jgi:outer membrane protein assembly factor BamA
VTRPRAAATIAGLKSGATVTPELLAGARERLQGSGLFTVVGEPRVVAGSEPGRARVVIPVEESNASHFAGAVGVAQGEGLTGTIDLGLGNIAAPDAPPARGGRATATGARSTRSDIESRRSSEAGRRLVRARRRRRDSLFSQTRWSLAFGGSSRRARGRVPGHAE